MGGIQVSRNKHKFITYKIFLIALSILTLTVFPAEAKKHVSIETKSKSPCLAIPQDNTLHKNVVVIETNRWKPSKCMWLAKKDELLNYNIDVVFPFEELFNAVCHIIVGVSDTHICYIHLTPLTSFFRRDTGELEKIAANLNTLTSKDKKWSYHVYYFDDNGKEDKFRAVLGKVLGISTVKFNPITPAAYSGGELNLILASGKLSYSVRNLRQWGYNDVSAKGLFNKIPIDAFE